MNNVFISTDKNKIDITLVHSFLTQSYWAKGISRLVVENSIQYSTCFGLYQNNGVQIGFGRVITDRSTFAYIADVFIVEECRNRGLGKYLIENMIKYTQEIQVRRVMLATADAHELYKKYGFEKVSNSPTYMDKISFQ